MRGAGGALCIVAAAMGAWLVVALYVGPVEKPGMFPLPVDAVLVYGGVAALLGAAGVWLRRGPPALAILLLGAGAPMLNSRLIGSQDTEPAAELVFRIVREGTLHVPGPHTWSVRLDDGSYASKYPVTTAILALPIALPASLGQGALTPRFRNVVEKLCASAMTGAMLALLFMTARRLSGERLALIACALTLFGTATLPILAQALWQHTGAALALAAGLAALGLPRGARRSAIVGACAGVAVACRPPDLPLALGLLWFERRPLTAIVAAVPVGLTLVYNALMFGGPLRTGYGVEASIGWHPPWPDGAIGFAGIWFSPPRGLFVCYPILIFALYGLWRRRELAPLLAAIVAESLLMGCWWAWEGGWCPGPRMLADATPFFALGLCAALERWSAWRPSARAALAGAAALSCANAMAMGYVVARPAAYALFGQLRDGSWTPRSWPLYAYLFVR